MPHALLARYTTVSVCGTVVTKNWENLPILLAVSVLLDTTHNLQKNFLESVFDLSKALVLRNETLYVVNAE
jgi:hypothetical protein